MPNLHPIGRAPLTDIPAQLRAAANRAEEDPPKSAILVTVDEDGEVETYGWGRTDAPDTLATLHIAAFKLTRSMADGEL